MRFAPGLTLALALALVAPVAGALVWPDVPERVERGLKSPDPMVRRTAARELADVGRARGATLVMQALADQDTDVRLIAAESAIRLHVEGATEAALPWLGDRDARLRVAACEVARALPNPKAIAQLARALGDADASVRAAAADALGSQTARAAGATARGPQDAASAARPAWTAQDDAVAPLLGKLDDASPAVRVQIARSLARLGDGRAVVPLAGKVQDSVPEVRQAVARALGELGDLRATSALLLQLRDTTSEVRVEALGALGRLRAPDAATAIAPLAADRAVGTRLAALAALGRIASPHAVSALVALLGQGDDASGGLERTPVRDALVAAGSAAIGELAAVLDRPPSPAAATSAAWVLGELHARAQAVAIVGAMRRGALPTAAALHALAGCGASESVPVVLEFTGDASPVVRAEAIGAAGALLDPARPDGRAVEPLAAALRDARLSTAERASIAALLGRTGAPRAAPVLASLTSVKDGSLRLAAIDALGTLGPVDDAGAGGALATDALLAAIADVDPQVRLHAAVSLAESGGSLARDKLLLALDGVDELDRTSCLTALGGILSRAPSEPAIARLAKMLDLAAGPERDAVLEAIGRAPLPAARRALERAATSEDADDRRTAVTLLALHPAAPDALRTALDRVKDPDASVRAQAAWALGAIGDAGAIAGLAPLLAATDADPAVNAAASIGRIAARAGAPQLAAEPLCKALGDLRPLVRANALAGLAAAKARCNDGAERRLLESDPVDAVRAAAALAVARAPSPEGARALERCAAEDHSGAVALRCRTPPAAPSASHTVLVYPVAEGQATPKPHAAYALLLADGAIHAGTCDRRGAALEPAAPDGDVALLRSSSR